LGVRPRRWKGNLKRKRGKRLPHRLPLFPRRIQGVCKRESRYIIAIKNNAAGKTLTSQISERSTKTFAQLFCSVNPFNTSITRQIPMFTVVLFGQLMTKPIIRSKLAESLKYPSRICPLHTLRLQHLRPPDE